MARRLLVLTMLVVPLLVAPTVASAMGAREHKDSRLICRRRADGVGVATVGGEVERAHRLEPERKQGSAGGGGPPDVTDGGCERAARCVTGEHIYGVRRKDVHTRSVVRDDDRLRYESRERRDPAAVVTVSVETPA